MNNNWPFKKITFHFRQSNSSVHWRWTANTFTAYHGCWNIWAPDGRTSAERLSEKSHSAA